MSSSASSNLSKRTYKIILLGDSGVGKTSLINRFVNNKFDPQASSTIGIDFVGKNVMHKEVSYRLQLWDTAGQQKYRSLIPTYLKDALCAIFIYDNSNPKTLENLETWIRFFKDNKTEKTVMVLCGNKIDLQMNSNTNGGRPTKKDKTPKIEETTEQDDEQSTQNKPEQGGQTPVIDLDTLKLLIKKYDLLDFQVSAGTGFNVNEMFHAIIQTLSQEQQQKKKKFSQIEIPLSSNELNSERNTENEDEMRPSMKSIDSPKSSSRRRRRKKLSQREQEIQGLQDGKKVSFWSRYCSFCGK